jgi:phosphate binding protein
MKFSKFLALALVLSLLLPVLSAMAQDEMVEAILLPEVDPAFVEGDIVTAGSSTVFPVTAAMVERFAEAGYGGEITVDSIGTGAGFERFCVNGETDISNASRAIREGEVESCTAIGRTPIEFRVGTDALAIAVSLENDFIGEEGLTVEQIGKIFGGEFTTWDQVNADYPAETILLYSPGTDSGTFDYFVEEVMVPFAEAAGASEDAAEDAAVEAILAAPAIQLSEDDNVLVSGVSSSPFAIGYFGYAYYLENVDKVRALAVDGVTATNEAVEAGDYPLARPLFIYSDAAIMAEKPQVLAFIGYYLANVDEVVSEVGYFVASVEAENEAKLHWAAVYCEVDGTDAEFCEMAAPLIEEMMAEMEG